MRIPHWTPEQKPQPKDLVDAILARRGGALLNLDHALLWSEPVARGWNGQKPPNRPLPSVHHPVAFLRAYGAHVKNQQFFSAA